MEDRRADEIDLRERPSGRGEDRDRSRALGAEGDPHGRQADSPTQIPGRGWRDVAVRVLRQMKEDNVTILAAGVAFFAVLSLFPAMTALLSLYGLIASPSDVARQIEDLGQTVPDDVRQLLTEQLTNITSGSTGALSIGLVVSVVLAFWSASAAIKHLLVVLSTAYDETETRGYVRLRLTAAAFTIAAVVALGAVLFLLTALPKVAGDVLGDAGATAVTILRWPVLLVVMLAALALLYRFGPDRDEPKWRWVSAGSVLATVLWLVACIAFSFYAAHFGSYDKTYGAIASVVVLMLWLFLTALCVILGAELNAELERQTMQDSTVGPDRPLGARDAEAADTVGATAEELRGRGRGGADQGAPERTGSGAAG